VERFLQSNKGFELIDQQTVSASESGYDGFYMALIKRNN
jgi:16S rRNA (cytosine967-C5)-methyltransferase